MNTLQGVDHRQFIPIAVFDMGYTHTCIEYAFGTSVVELIDCEFSSVLPSLSASIFSRRVYNLYGLGDFCEYLWTDCES